MLSHPSQLVGRAHVTSSLILTPVLRPKHTKTQSKWNPVLCRQSQREVCALMKKEHAIWHRYSLFSREHYQENAGGKVSYFFNLKVCCVGLGSPVPPELLNGLSFQFTFLYSLGILLIGGPFY